MGKQRHLRPVEIFTADFVEIILIVLKKYRSLKYLQFVHFCVLKAISIKTHLVWTWHEFILNWHKKPVFCISHNILLGEMAHLNPATICSCSRAHFRAHYGARPSPGLYHGSGEGMSSYWCFITAEQDKHPRADNFQSFYPNTSIVIGTFFFYSAWEKLPNQQKQIQTKHLHG